MLCVCLGSAVKKKKKKKKKTVISAITLLFTLNLTDLETQTFFIFFFKYHIHHYVFKTVLVGIKSSVLAVSALVSSRSQSVGCGSETNRE